MAVTRKDLEVRTIMELRSFAREHDIPLRRNWKKDEIIQAILRMVRPKRGRKPKPVQRKPSTVASQGKRSREVAKAEGPSTEKRPSLVRNLPGAGREKPPSSEGTPESELALMVRNADTLFAYWKTQQSSLERTEADRRPQGILRIHDISGSAQGLPGKDYYDIPVPQPSGTLYVSLRMPGHRFVGELGCPKGGVFHAWASSTEVETPRDRVFPPTPRSMTFFLRVYGVSKGTPLSLEDIPAVFSGDG